MEKVTLKAVARAKTGTRDSRRAREAGQIPVIIYGHGEATEMALLPLREVTVFIAQGARTLEIDLKGSKKPYLIKAVQYDHLGTNPVHLDLTRVDLNERVRLRVGIELRGTPKGISEGGVLDQSMASIEVECLVTEIPGTLHPNVTHLALGEVLYVKDLVLPAGVRAVAEGSERVAAVRAMVEEAVAAPAPEGEAVVAEPERIGRIRKDEETEEGAKP